MVHWTLDPALPGWTALMYASQNGHERCALELLKAKADPNKANDQGVTALMRAAKNGHEGCARALLEAGADPTKEIPGYSGRNAFKLAESNGHTAVCDLLKQ